jgi:peptidoglycan/xylan/chitin deacetylase (PgdA/CDA1 family)
MIMTWDHVRALQAGGQDIGSHTRTHRVLQTITDAELDDELRGSRLELEAQLGQAVRALAYPVGYSVLGDKRIVSAVERAGYQVAFTNASGINHTRRPHRLDVRRVAMEYGMTMALFRASVALPTLR